MKLSNTRSVIYLFVAMVISSVVIGSICQTKFVPVPSVVEAASLDSVSTKYAPVDVDMSLKQVAEHTWYVQGKAGIATDNAGFISNAGVVITDKGVVIIDALGTPSLANKLLQEIRKITDKPVLKVFVTHYHADHIYGLQVFKEQGAEIIAPQGAYEYIDSDAASSRLEERQFSLEPWVNENTKIVVPDRIIDKSEEISVGGFTFILSYVGPAHSDGDMTVYVENDRVLFTGDLIFEGRVPLLGSDNTKHWLETLKTIESKKLHALVPGHGATAQDPMKAISLTRSYLAFIREKMGAGVEEMLDFDEVYKSVDWSRYAQLPAFKEANRKNAYQVYLSMEQEE